MARHTNCALALCGIFVVAATGHPSAQQPIFRSGIGIVEVTVSVRDREGRFVAGLGAADFEVLEEGRPRRIETMYVVTTPDRVSSDAAAAIAPAPRGRTAPRTFVFAFDLGQLSPRSFTRARDAALNFARDRLRPSDASGLVVLGSTSAGRISPDHKNLMAGLAQLKPSSDLAARERPLREWPRILTAKEASDIANDIGKTLDDAKERACREHSQDCPAIADRELIEVELRSKARAYIAASRTAALRSIGSLQSLAAALEAIRGRKTIVWFTEGTTILEGANQAREAAIRAAQSGVAVYTIDPRGLQSRTADLEQITERELGHDIFSDTGDLPTLMASATGALYIRNENRLDRALAKIEDDTSSYYVIGYAADPGSDRSQRKVTVRLKRQDISARVRHGFMAPPGTMSTTGSMVASSVTTVPGERWELAPPAIHAPTAPTPPLSTLTTAPTSTHVPTTENVLRLRGISGGATSDLASRGWQAYERGDLESALPLLEQAAGRKDVRPWTLYALGFTYVGLGRSRDALAAWERVRAAAPDFTPVYLDLAAHYTQLSDVSEALAILREAAKRWPDDHEVQNGIGVLLVRRNAMGDAITAFTRATQIAPADPLSWLNLGRAYELRYERSLRYDEHLLRWVGSEGDRAKARESYERSVQLGGPYAQQAAEALARMNWSQ